MMAQGTVKPLAWFTHHTVGKLGAGSLTPVGPGPMPLPIALWCLADLFRLCAYLAKEKS